MSWCKSIIFSIIRSGRVLEIHLSMVLGHHTVTIPTYVLANCIALGWNCGIQKKQILVFWIMLFQSKIFSDIIFFINKNLLFTFLAGCKINKMVDTIRIQNEPSRGKFAFPSGKRIRDNLKFFVGIPDNPKKCMGKKVRLTLIKKVQKWTSANVWHYILRMQRFFKSIIKTCKDTKDSSHR